jgi:hypothetical protein
MKCYEYFKCNKTNCPVRESVELKLPCWLVADTFQLYCARNNKYNKCHADIKVHDVQEKCKKCDYYKLYHTK